MFDTLSFTLLAVYPSNELYECIVYVKMNDLLENNNALEFESLIMCYFPYNREVEIPKEVILKVEI